MCSLLHSRLSPGFCLCLLRQSGFFLHTFRAFLRERDDLLSLFFRNPSELS